MAKSDACLSRGGHFVFQGNRGLKSDYRGRFAPSPTGELHAGSLLAALVSWLRARQAGGQWLLRVEDIDPPREVAGSARSILRELARLGMLGDAPVLYQSTRVKAYRQALDQLRADGHAFACWCSRSDLAEHDGMHRDGHCVTPPQTDREPAWRLRVADTLITFEDGLQGHQNQNLHEAVGDFVLRRADGLWAYQLACVVDDAFQGITEVVRGLDLLDSTPRQIHLQQLLGLPTPAYIHLPLVNDAQGHKLSKSDLDQPLSGQPVATLLGQTLARLGIALPTEPISTGHLLEHALSHFDLQPLAHGLAAPTQVGLRSSSRRPASGEP